MPGKRNRKTRIRRVRRWCRPEDRGVARGKKMLKEWSDTIKPLGVMETVKHKGWMPVSITSLVTSWKSIQMYCHRLLDHLLVGIQAKITNHYHGPATLNFII